MFRRFRRGSKGFQSKQFLINGSIALAGTAQGAPTYFAEDKVIIGPDQLFGIGTPVQASMKRASVVSIDYFFNGFTLATDDSLGVRIFPQNFAAIYKDTLDNAGVPDASGDFFLNVDQIDGTTNQQLFPERILDRRMFLLSWYSTNNQGPGQASIGVMDPGSTNERRVRRRVSINNREALMSRVEVLFPANPTGQNLEFNYAFYGVLNFRVDL